MLPSVTAYWDDKAATFDADADHGLRDPAVRAAWARRLAGWLPPPPSDVLDAGCGTGSLSLLMAQAGHRVHGVDLSPAMVAAARAKCTGHDVALSVGDAAEPPLERASVDAVVVRHLLWTLPDPHLALAQWVRLLREDGRLVLVEGRWAQPDDATPYAQGTESMPWRGGVTRDLLVAAVEPLAASVVVHDLTADDDLWGRSVSDERYALVVRT